MRLALPINVLSLAVACLSCATGHARSARLHDTAGLVINHSIDGMVRARPVPGLPTPPLLSRTSAPPVPTAVCSAQPVDWHGQTLPDGEAGTLNPQSFFRSATMNGHGRIAFVSKVDDAERNQGVFTADADGLRVVAMGCGGEGGSGKPDDCGDPAPIGGTFSGFFGGTLGTPDINDNGDVLFLADLDGAPAPRGLFLYRAADHHFDKVAAVGDPSPLGGTFTALGPGSMNSSGTVVFLAITDDAETSDIFRWQDGVLAKYVATGDPAPGGGTFRVLGGETWGYADGTVIAGGPVPGINEDGMIAFRGYVDDGESPGGLFLSIAGLHAWMVKAGDTDPDGGTYLDFAAPLLNDNGEIAFYADRSFDSQQQGVWVAGSPASWRTVVAPDEEIDGGHIWGMAYSRNPMRALNANGDVVLWTSRIMPDQSELGTILLNHADGAVDVLAVQGEEAPFGGYWGGSFDGWPVINASGQVRIGAATPGFALSSDVIVTACTDSDSIFTDGFESAGASRASDR